MKPFHRRFPLYSRKHFGAEVETEDGWPKKLPNLPTPQVGDLPSSAKLAGVARRAADYRWGASGGVLAGGWRCFVACS
jgi:hypothetical protein